MQREILERELEVLKDYLVEDVNRLSSEIVSEGSYYTYTSNTPISVLIDIHKKLRREQQKRYQNLGSTDNDRGR